LLLDGELIKRRSRAVAFRRQGSRGARGAGDGDTGLGTGTRKWGQGPGAGDTKLGTGTQSWGQGLGAGDGDRKLGTDVWG